MYDYFKRLYDLFLYCVLICIKVSVIVVEKVCMMLFFIGKVCWDK